MLFDHWTEDQPEKYRRIIHAAIHVFAKQGFHHAKVTDVAKAADVADGTIYLYFKNKDDLLISIFEHSMDLFLSQARDVLASDTTAMAKLKDFVRLHLLAVDKNQELAQVLQIELRSSNKFMIEYKADKFFEYLRFVEDIVREGQQSGEFREELNPEIVTRSLFGAIDEMALEWVLSHKKRFTIEEAAAQVVAIFTNGISKEAA